jgi:hypothetical protein
MNNEAVPMPDSVLSLITKAAIPLYAASEGRMDSFQTAVFKSQGEEAASRQGLALGDQPHPFDFAQVKSFLTGNEHHSACIHTKVASTVGLGFIDSQEEVVIENPVAAATPPVGTDARTGLPAPEMLPMPKTRKQYTDSKVDLAINPLCMISATDLLHDACEDFWQVGNGLIEVVRSRDSNEIVGLHHLPAEEATVFLEDTDYNFHYIINSDGDATERRFARFGDWEDFESRASGGDGAGMFTMPDGQTDAEFVSEVIHFRQPTSLSRWYGFPKWLAAVPPIELAQMLLQWKYDFFLNRGVPEFIFLLTGQKLKTSDWEKIESALKANIGLGNSHKSLALNIGNPEVKAQVEKLAAESKGDETFATTKESLALSIVTAHRVPPLLAGIQIPGKLGATNELPNALMAFQLLVIGQAQRIWQQTLATTLGAENGIDGLAPEDFAFTKITEEIDVSSMDTVARMRQSPMQAASEGRDLDDGTKE